VKIRTKLIINITIPVILLIIAVWGMWMMNRELDNISMEDSLNQEMIEGVFTLNVLTSEYMLYQSERTELQWSWQHEKLRSILSKIQAAGDREERALVKKILVNFKDLRIFFQKLIKSEGRVLSKKGKESNEVLVSRILSGAQAMVFLGKRLNAKNRQDLIEFRKAVRLAFILFIAFGFISLFSFSLQLYSGVKPSLENLEKGVREIGRGNLKYRTEIRTGDELGELSNAFNVMASKLESSYESLEKRNRELQDFAFIASHDLQEPLRVIAGYIQLARKNMVGQLNAKGEEFVKGAVEASHRMQRMISALMLYSSIGMQNEAIQRVDMEKILEETLANLRIMIEEKKATITHDPLPDVRANESLIIRVFQNIIENAMKFSGKSLPEIHISSRKKEDFIEFSIRDNGIGIESQYQDVIFKMFKRLHTRSEYPGSGVGLGICKKIVESFGGEIRVESISGVGSVFYFTLPAYKEENENGE
jgi:signal transduction histidine kinase